MANPWDPLPKDKVGNKDSATLYAAVGRALSAWESLEANLGQMFGLMSGSLSEVPARAYGVVASANGRLEMAKEAFACYPGRNEPELVGIGDLLKRVGKFIPRRNEIAHGIVTGVTIEDDMQGAFLCPARYMSRKQVSIAAIQDTIRGGGTFEHASFVGKYAYNSKQLAHYKKQFLQLSREAYEFNKLLAGRLTHSHKK